MPSRPESVGVPPIRSRLFALLTSLWLVVVVSKFGNPVIFGQLIEPPHGWREWVHLAWPLSWAYGYCALLFLGAVLVLRPARDVPVWLLISPAAWLVWQCLSAGQTEDGGLTRQVLPHFGCAVLCFYLGLWVRSEALHQVWLLLSAALALAIVMGVGLEQHFGGLERARQSLAELPPELRARFTTPNALKKLASDRIFGTFIYPNAFAGVLLLLVPASLVGLFQVTRRWPISGRWVVRLTFAAAALACLYWSGSKSGWLIALVAGMVAFWRSAASRKQKLLATGLIVLLGGGAFAVRYAQYFERGAPSVGARLDYWTAAWTLIQERPILGHGPGTFGVGYGRLKPSGAEMTRLAHNDYLQQATDSGLVGMVFYLIWVGGGLFWSWRQLAPGFTSAAGWWLGVASLAGQSLVEFGLYIPALAWPAFLFLGLLGRPGNGIDKQGTRPYPPPA